MMKTMLHAGIIAEETSKSCYRFLMKNEEDNVKEIKCDSDKPVIRILDSTTEYNIKLAALTAIVEREKFDRTAEYTTTAHITTTIRDTTSNIEYLAEGEEMVEDKFEFKLY